MQALAFPFDLHVLSTPPAFILSQDQTLHKNTHKREHQSVKDYRAVKSPKPNQNKPHQHHTKDAGLAHPKITRQTKKVHPTLLPQSTRKKDNNKKYLISHATNQTTPFHQWFKQHRPAHTPKTE